MPIHFQRITIPILNSNGHNYVKFFSIFHLHSYFLSEDLFAEGTDFSSSTIEKNRNIYFQKQQADQVVSQTIETMSLLTNALKIHLNLGQNSTMNTSSVFMSLETLSMDSLHNKIIRPLGNAQIHLPENFQVNSTGISLRVSLHHPFL